ncbi:MAG: DUF6290 family protein [Spirochaetaceae bacterium]|jgi:RHH-type rel operon transcriptional repressor/antitoxin RelB|nr:DUF6290 family protein [Spirochaetaceae bacterium]
MISVQLRNNEDARLGALARRTKRTKAFFVREAVERYLEDMEDYYLARKIASEVDTGNMKTFTATEVRQQLGL